MSYYNGRSVYCYFSKLDEKRHFDSADEARDFDRTMAIAAVIGLDVQDFRGALEHGRPYLSEALKFLAEEIDDEERRRRTRADMPDRPADPLRCDP